MDKDWGLEGYEEGDLGKGGRGRRGEREENVETQATVSSHWVKLVKQYKYRQLQN